MPVNNSVVIDIKVQYQNSNLGELKTALKDLQSGLDNLKSSNQQGTQAWDDQKSKILGVVQSIASYSRELKGLDANTKMSTSSMLNFGKNISAIYLGLQESTKAISAIISNMKEMVSQGAEYGELRDRFYELSGGAEEAEKQISQMKQASAGNLDEMALIKYTAMMKLLGFSTTETAQVLDICDERAKQVGTSFERGEKALQTFILTGRAKSLRELGINVADVNKEVEKLTIVAVDAGKSLDEEGIQAIRTQAILNLYGRTTEEISRKTKTNSDEIKSLANETTNMKNKMGDAIANGFVHLIKNLGLTTQEGAKTAASMSVIGSKMGELLPIVASLKLAFPGLGSSIASVFGSGGPIIVAIGLTIWWVAELISKIKEADREAKQLSAYNQRKKDGTEVGFYDQNAPDQKTLNAYNKQLEKTPDADIKVDGKTQKLKDYVKTLQDNADKSKQSTYWNEQFSNQIERTTDNTNIQKRSLQDLTDKTSTYKKSLENFKGTIEDRNVLQEKYNKAVKDEKELKDKLFPEDKKKGGNKPNLEALENKALSEIIDKYKDKLMLTELENKVDGEIVINRRTILSDALEELKANYTSLVYAKDKVKNLNEQKDINALIEKSYGKQKEAISKIAEAYKFIDSVNRKMKNPNGEASNGIYQEGNWIGSGDAKNNTRKKYDKKGNGGADEAGSTDYQKAGEKVQSILDVATQTVNILGLGADSFIGKMLGGFQQVIGLADSVVSMLAKLGAIGGDAASGGIFGILGGLLGFADGGYTGNMATNQIAGFVHGGEYVWDAKTTARYFPLLQALHNGNPYSQIARYSQGGYVNRNVNNNNVYITANQDGITFLKNNFPEYISDRGFTKIR